MMWMLMMIVRLNIMEMFVSWMDDDNDVDGD